MPGPDQRELPQFYPAERLREAAMKPLGEPIFRPLLDDLRQLDFQVKLDDIIERLRRIEAEVAGQLVIDRKYLIEKKGAIWTATDTSSDLKK